ncbi:MAG TPA: hypothetical protein VF404_04890 [Sphingomonas sp.]
MATPPPSPPSPPQGDATPDGGNPAGAVPPTVAPKPGRQSEHTKPAGKKATSAKAKTPKANAKAPAEPARLAASAAPRKPAKPRAAAPRRAAARPRTRPTGISVATVPTIQPTDVSATDPATRSGRRWWKAVAGGVGALAAGAALLSLKGSSRRKAHQADGTDSSKSFDAGIADEGTIPEKPTDR